VAIVEAVDRWTGAVGNTETERGRTCSAMVEPADSYSTDDDRVCIEGETY